MAQGAKTVRARSMRAGLACLLATLAALALTAAGAQEGVTVDIAGLTAEGDSVQAVLTVIDADGRPIAGLSADDFEARLNGEPAAVTAVDRGVDSSLPIAVVLALDVSGSMEGDALLEAKAAAGHFLESLSPQDTVAVVTFGDRVDLALPFTTDRAAAANAIDGLTAAGATALYQATDESLRLAASAPSGRRAVVLLSDGVDHGSVLPREETLAAAQNLGVPVFAIGLGQDIDRAYLRELSSSSGGRFAETPSPAGLADLYQQAGEQLRGQYIVALDGAALGIVPSEPVTATVSLAVGGETASAERSFCLQSLCVALQETEPALDEKEPRTFTAVVLATEPVTSVTFFVDGKQVLERIEPPYAFTFDPAAYESGDYALTARATTASDEVETQATPLTVAAAGGGRGLMKLAVPVVAAAAVGAVVLLLFRRRRRGGRGKERPLDPSGLVPPGRARPLPDSRPPLPDARPALQPMEEALGKLVVTGGPLAGHTFDVGGSPVSLGSGESCRVRLSQVVDDEELIPVEHARVWIREGHLMVHEVRRLTADGAEGGRWQKLESGDVLSIGTHTLVFQIAAGADAAAPAAVLDDGVPNILRSHDDDPVPSAPDAGASRSPMPPSQMAGWDTTPAAPTAGASPRSGGGEASAPPPADAPPWPLSPHIPLRPQGEE